MAVGVGILVVFPRGNTKGREVTGWHRGSGAGGGCREVRSGAAGRVRARLARRSGVRASGGGGGRRALRGLPERGAGAARVGGGRVGRARKAAGLLGAARSPRAPRFPRRLRAPPVRRSRARAAPGRGRAVAAAGGVRRARTAPREPEAAEGLDGAGDAVVRGRGLGRELLRAGYGYGPGSRAGPRGTGRALNVAARRSVPRPRPLLPGARSVRGADRGAAVQLRHPQLPPAHRQSLRLRRRVPPLPAGPQRHHLRPHRSHLLRPPGGAVLRAAARRAVRALALVGRVSAGLRELRELRAAAVGRVLMRCPQLRAVRGGADGHDGAAEPLRHRGPCGRRELRVRRAARSRRSGGAV